MNEAHGRSNSLRVPQTYIGVDKVQGEVESKLLGLENVRRRLGKDVAGVSAQGNRNVSLAVTVEPQDDFRLKRSSNGWRLRQLM